MGEMQADTGTMIAILVPPGAMFQPGLGACSVTPASAA
jgi:hypothetical protein